MKAKEHQKTTPMVLYLAEGKWSKEIEEFAVWSYHYDMWCKMTFFGEEMSKQMEHEVVGKSRGYITQDPLTGVYRKTEAYLAKHPQAA